MNQKNSGSACYWMGTTSAWALEMLKSIQSSEHSEIVVCIMPKATPAQPRPFVKRLLANLPSLGPIVTRKALDLFYEKVLERNTYIRPSEASSNIRTLLPNLPFYRSSTNSHQMVRLFSVRSISNVFKSTNSMFCFGWGSAYYAAAY